ncbi:hypothetical protein EMIHUDRAFT_202368 [Emiliania huxleyi CCMP1516]|uniref:Autophagy protein ATG5 UblB domain-containing protein n=2 Tax=Emiliania huxleyi TaxID=2903 RepID=A0A0D3KBM6_EMIH1|nr:hypothetical protein EMIHUDRAFT_202368 [Emiliania huxleyi CCMP1516]EOD33161.1 hypothetical protein EMIHUDRAFT_202368 [Emiliania huxleyi CCMP1516]|eukprot:XP_005785590.1 hypothetical protein EMIHUDRAFT_202368 [Emiliania huxleyi CCMP1516]
MPDFSKACVRAALCADRAAFVAQREWRQLPVAPLLPSGDPTTRVHVLAASTRGVAASDAESSGGEGQRPTAIVQGVVVELNTPVSWLYEACSHPDGFLYVQCQLPRRTLRADE